MGDERDDDLMPDVPRSAIVVHTPQEARALARKISGARLNNELEFHCITCGWGGTLQFDADDMEALQGDIRAYSGPCGTCGSQTLVPKDSLFGSSFRSIDEQVRENKESDWRGQARVLVDTVKQEMLAGSLFDGAGASVDDSDLPSADDIGIEGMKPFGGNDDSR